MVSWFLVFRFLGLRFLGFWFLVSKFHVLWLTLFPYPRFATFYWTDLHRGHQLFSHFSARHWLAIHQPPTRKLPTTYLPHACHLQATCCYLPANCLQPTGHFGATHYLETLHLSNPVPCRFETAMRISNLKKVKPWEFNFLDIMLHFEELICFWCTWTAIHCTARPVINLTFKICLTPNLSNYSSWLKNKYCCGSGMPLNLARLGENNEELQHSFSLISGHRMKCRDQRTNDMDIALGLNNSALFRQNNTNLEGEIYI